MNDSQPRKRETIQMNRVLHVSIVERDVALTVRVTERPKKLNPLNGVSNVALGYDSGGEVK